MSQTEARHRRAPTDRNPANPNNPENPDSDSLKIPLRMQKKYLTTLDKAVHTVYPYIYKGFAVFSKKGVTAQCCHRNCGRQGCRPDVFLFIRRCVMPQTSKQNFSENIPLPDSLSRNTGCPAESADSFKKTLDFSIKIRLFSFIQSTPALCKNQSVPGRSCAGCSPLFLGSAKLFDISENSG
jgi:hypothetical protein